MKLGKKASAEKRPRIEIDMENAQKLVGKTIRIPTKNFKNLPWKHRGQKERIGLTTADGLVPSNGKWVGQVASIQLVKRKGKDPYILVWSKLRQFGERLFDVWYVDAHEYVDQRAMNSIP